MADHIVFNIPLPNIEEIIGTHQFTQLGIRYSKQQKQPMWGAVTMYIAVHKKVIPDDTPLFHQVMENEHTDEGNHIFISLSKIGDVLRAPAHARTITFTRLETSGNFTFQTTISKKSNTLLKCHNVKRAANIEDGIIELIAAHRKHGKRLHLVKNHRWLRSNNDQTLFRAYPSNNVNNVWMCGDSVFLAHLL